MWIIKTVFRSTWAHPLLVVNTETGSSRFTKQDSVQSVQPRELKVRAELNAIESVCASGKNLKNLSLTTQGSKTPYNKSNSSHILSHWAGGSSLVTRTCLERICSTTVTWLPQSRKSHLLSQLLRPRRNSQFQTLVGSNVAVTLTWSPQVDLGK
jgi:hypothetical protein